MSGLEQIVCYLSVIRAAEGGHAPYAFTIHMHSRSINNVDSVCRRLHWL